MGAVKFKAKGKVGKSLLTNKVDFIFFFRTMEELWFLYRLSKFRMVDRLLWA